MSLSTKKFTFTHANPKENLGGFTIIELLVASTIFSIVLVVIVSSFLQVGRMFYKGVSINNTNEATRNLVDDITNDARFSNFFDAGNTTQPTLPPNAKHYFCIGSHRYTYLLNTQVKDADINATAASMAAGIVQDTANGCPDLSVAGTNPTQVLGPGMRLNLLNVGKNNSGSGLLIHAHVIFYGADDTVFASTSNAPNAINAPDAYCSGNLLSTQFCAMSDISTNVTLRF
jgi:prepilin-type N-terminal cleavage/methylation domain-containing protein